MRHAPRTVHHALCTVQVEQPHGSSLHQFESVLCTKISGSHEIEKKRIKNRNVVHLETRRLTIFEKNDVNLRQLEPQKTFFGKFPPCDFE